MVALSVVGDVPPNAIQPPLPDGVHLRWSFAPARGFPWHGYYLFRRDAHRPKPMCLARWHGHQVAGPYSQSTLDTPIGRWSSDPPLLFTDRFPATGASEVGLAQREWLRFDLSSAYHASRVVARIGFLAQRCRWYTVPRKLRAPWSDRGITMRWHDRAGHEPRGGRITTIAGITGVDCAFETEIQFEEAHDEVALALVTFGSDVSVFAFDRHGKEVARSHAPGSRAGTHHIELRARDIVRVTIVAPDDRTLLVELCPRPGRDRREEVEVIALAGDVEVGRVVTRGGDGEIVEVQLASDAITSVRFSGAAASVIDVCFDIVEENASWGWKPVSGFGYPMPLPVAHADYPCPGKPASAAAAEAMAMGRVMYGDTNRWQGTSFAEMYDLMEALVVGGPAGLPMIARTVSVAEEGGSPVTMPTTRRRSP